MKTMKLKLIVRRESGLVSIFTLALLSLFLATGIAMFELHQGASANSANMRGDGQARELAQSALQEAKWYTMRVNSGWTGTRPEQPLVLAGLPLGSFDYTTARSGNVYTVTANGYYPNKTHPQKITRTLQSTFTYTTVGLAILVLDGSAEGSLSVTDNGIMTVENGSIVVNSSHAKAVVAGGNATVKAPQINIVGGYALSDGASLLDVINTKYPAAADPLGAILEPVASDYAVQSAKTLNISKDTTLNPGRYVGGISVTSAKVTLNPGVYYMEGGGFDITATGEVTGSEVMIFNDSSDATDDINLSGGGEMILSAPTSGDYKDIVLFQKRSATAEATISGNAQTSITGATYFAGGRLRLSGNGSGGFIGSVHVAKHVSISGNGSFTVSAPPE